MEKVDKRFGNWKMKLGLLKEVTNNFDKKNIIATGGFGSVYKASLPLFNRDRRFSRHPTGRVAVAIKRRTSTSTQGLDQFKMEIGLLTKFKHSNIVSLIGYCNDDGEMILVYEYASNRSFDSNYKDMPGITWAQSLKICIGVAHGLEYLHCGGKYEIKTVHRDIKSGNVLLDQNRQAKISDFGLSAFAPPGKQLSSMGYGPAGTPGYFDPNYLRKRCLSEKVDVYSFGVLLLEVSSGCFSTAFFPGFSDYDLEYNVEYRQIETVIPFLQEKVREKFNVLDTEANFSPFHAILDISKECLKDDPDERPNMKDIIVQLVELLKLNISALNLRISLEEIKKATNNFGDSNIIGWGESARVYKGKLSEFHGCKTVAVKRFKHHAEEVDFMTEILRLCDYKHKNIIAFHGFHYDENERILVYEHAFNGSLDKYLSNTSNKCSLTWEQRLNICLGAARGLDFIHKSEVDDGVVHRDVKSANILLTHDWEAKISNFGLSKRANKNGSKFLISSGAGTLGYCDPEYMNTGVLTKASDVYSFGVVLLEVLDRRLVLENDRCYYDEEVDERKRRRNKAVEKRSPKSLCTFAAIAARCVHANPDERPTMGHVVQELTKALEFQIKGSVVES